MLHVGDEAADRLRFGWDNRLVREHRAERVLEIVSGGLRPLAHQLDESIVDAARVDEPSGGIEHGGFGSDRWHRRPYERVAAIAEHDLRVPKRFQMIGDNPR